MARFLLLLAVLGGAARKAAADDDRPLLIELEPEALPAAIGAGVEVGTVEAERGDSLPRGIAGRERGLEPRLAPEASIAA